MEIPHDSAEPYEWPLESEEYQRYGRQLIMPEIGLQGQLRLKTSSVLVVGLGGLGCPAAAYLAGAGVNRIGLIDGDVVDLSNLHRQILHSTEKVGMTKIESAIQYLKALNSLVNLTPHHGALTPQNALEVFTHYDLILDCTDTPQSRYLISDAAILSGTPLVSASALRTEGQLMVLNNPPLLPGDISGGPCYRCIFPKPPPAESVVTCGDGGILGPVVGVMGVLQALEAIKLIIAGFNQSDAAQLNPLEQEPPKPTLLLFSAFSSPQFRSVRLRSRRVGCAACSAEATIVATSLSSGALDYVQFCGVSQPYNVLSPQERITVQEFSIERQDGAAPNTHHLIDVRERAQFEICSLKGSVNIPYSTISSWKDGDDMNKSLNQIILHNSIPIYFICRFGNDSQLAVRKALDFGLGQHGTRPVLDVLGGFKLWKEQVDSSWPQY